MLTVNILGNNESVGRIFIYLFIRFFPSIIFNANAHFASIIHHHYRFYTYKEKKLKLLIAIFVLLLSDHQFLFGFVFSPFLLLWKMWKIVDGGVERFARVTENTPE